MTRLIFSLLVTGPAFGTDQSIRALNFARAVIQKGHAIKGVFFYQDGVLNASAFLLPESDEPNPSLEWVDLANEHHIQLHVCIAAAQRRGIIDSVIATENNLLGSTAQSTFQLSGLGQLAELMLSSDRFIQF